MYNVKEGLTAEVVHLRNKVTSLQVDLDNNVAVQNDFARLNQLLLVELENFRQAEKELGRWSMVTDGKEEVTFRADVWFKGSSEKENLYCLEKEGGYYEGNLLCTHTSQRTLFWVLF